LESRAIEGIKTEVQSEIALLERDYEIIKNFLSGVEYDLSQIRQTLQSFKDKLSKVRSLIVAYFQMQGKNFDFQTSPILESIDMALVLMEYQPKIGLQQARLVLQMTLAMANIKIEDVMSFITTLEKTTFSQE
jgi:hypothetical protein